MADPRVSSLHANAGLSWIEIFWIYSRLNDTSGNSRSNDTTFQLGYYLSIDCNYDNGIKIIMVSDIDNHKHQYNITDLLPDSCYVIMLRAYSGTSYSPWSSTIARTTVSARKEALNDDSTEMQFEITAGL